MVLRKLYDPANGQMRIAGLMSGSGSNLRKIIESEKALQQELGSSPYHVAVIFTDRYDSNATLIGKDHNIPVVVRDIKSFYAAQGKPRKDLQVRSVYDQETVKALSPYDATVAAYAGYMSIATAPLINAFLGINVHPSDLSITENGKRKYIGDHAARDAIIAGEKELRSSTHIIEDCIDYGRILIISAPIQVNQEEICKITDRQTLNDSIHTYQNALKEKGDWTIFPQTLRFIADGRFSYDENKIVHFDGTPIPQGLHVQK